MGPRLGRVEYFGGRDDESVRERASMGPRLGRVEYGRFVHGGVCLCCGFNGATLRTRGIPIDRPGVYLDRSGFNGATLRTRGIRCYAGFEGLMPRLLQWGHA